MMRQSYRLCFLQMRKSRHISVYMLLHQIIKSAKKLYDESSCFKDLISCIHPHIKGNLIIPAPAGMKLFPCLTYSFSQVSLNEAVNILIFICYLYISVLNIIKDRIKSQLYRLLVLCGYNALFCQHPCMYFASGYVLLIQLFVKGYGSIKSIYKLICFLFKSSAPQLSHLYYPHTFFFLYLNRIINI